MAWIDLETRIRASQEDVFNVVAHMENYAKAVPHIKSYEFLTEQTTGVGARFTETRSMGNKEHTMQFEVKEYSPSNAVRLVTEGDEATWDSTFEIEALDDEVNLRLAMDVFPKKMSLRLMLPIVKGAIRKGVATDMQCVKQYCEED